MEIARRRTNARLYWDHRYFLHFGIRELPKKFKRHSYDGFLWVETGLQDLRGSEAEDAIRCDEEDGGRLRAAMEHASRLEAFRASQEAWAEHYEELHQCVTQYTKAPARQAPSRQRS